VPGNPLRLTLPVAKTQEGCVIKPIIGAGGVGTLLIVNALVADEVHGPSLVTFQV
jgi:predicted ATP-grasp superfamily ATP-dependent carboligase